MHRPGEWQRDPWLGRIYVIGAKAPIQFLHTGHPAAGAALCSGIAFSTATGLLGTKGRVFRGRVGLRKRDGCSRMGLRFPTVRGGLGAAAGGQGSIAGVGVHILIWIAAAGQHRCYQNHSQCKNCVLFHKFLLKFRVQGYYFPELCRYSVKFHQMPCIDIFLGKRWFSALNFREQSCIIHMLIL